MNEKHALGKERVFIPESFLLPECSVLQCDRLSIINIIVTFTGYLHTAP